MSTFEHKNSLRTIEAQIVQKLKNNEARSKFTGSYKKKSVYTTTYGLQSFRYLATKSWNSLPDSSRSVINFNEFRNLIYSYSFSDNKFNIYL